MPATVSHVLSATTPDDPAYEIRPSHWNSAHAFTFNAEGSEISGAFSNTPGGVTFGLETNGFITAGAPAGGGGITAINVSAGTLSQNLSALTFSNGGGVSFGLAASVITASVATNYQSQGAYLTTAMASNASSVFAGVGETVTTTTGTALALTVDTNGVRIAHPLYLTTAQPVGAYLTTARASNDAVGLNTAVTNVTWTVNSSGISLNAGAYLTTAAQSNHSHGNPTLNLTNLSGTTASNSAGFTLSLSAAAGGGGADGGNTIIAGTRTAGSNSAVLFDNANGITFGLNAVGGSILTASHNALTTARASNDAVGLNTALTANGVAWTVNSSGISLSVPAFLTTAMQSNAATISNIRVSGGTTSNLLSAITFGDANGVSFGLNAGTMTASHNGLTTAAQSNHSHGNPSLALTNLSGTTASNSAGFTLSLSAGNYLTTAALSNHSHGASAANGSFGFQTLSFSNANGVSFGTSGGSAITASHNGLTTAAASNHSHGNPQLNLTNLSGTTASNSAGFTLSLSAGAGGAGDGGNILAAGTRTAGTNSSVLFDNANGITFGLNAVNGSIMTASHNGLTTARASNDGVGLNTAQTNVTWTVNSSGISINGAGYAGTGTTFAGANISGSLTQNSNGINMSLSVAAPGAAAENNWFALTGNTVGNTTASGSTIALSGGNNITLSGTNGSVIRIDAPASSSLVGTNGISISTNGSTVSISGLGVNVSAGTTSNNMTAMTFSNANGVSFGLNGSVVTGSVAPAGGGYILRDWDNAQLIGSMNLISNLTATIFSRGRPLFVPVHLHGGLSFNNAMIEVSRQTSGNNAFTINAGLYRFSNSTRIDLVGSFQNVYSGANTASISGIRRIQMTHANTDLTSLSAGHYILALGFSAAGDSTSAMNYSIRGGLTANPPVGLIGPGSDANTTATSALSGIPLRLFRGLWSTTSAVMPASVALADVSAWTTGGHPYIWMGSR